MVITERTVFKSGVQSGRMLTGLQVAREIESYVISHCLMTVVERMLSSVYVT